MLDDPASAHEFMHILTDLLSVKLFFPHPPAHNKYIQLFRKEYCIFISTVCLITFLKALVAGLNKLQRVCLFECKTIRFCA